MKECPMPTRKEQAFAAYDKAVVQGRAASDTMVAAAAQDLEQAKAKAFELLVAAMQQVREAYDVEIILAHTSHAEAAAQAAQAFDDAVAPARQALDEAMLVEEDAPKHAKAARTAAAATLSAVQAEPVPVAAPQSDLAAILAQAAPAIDIAEQELPGDVGALELAIDGELPGAAGEDDELVLDGDPQEDAASDPVDRFADYRVGALNDDTDPSNLF